MISDALKELLMKEIPTMEGWTIPERCIEMANLIALQRPRTVVEIGVFGGRTMIAQALALKEINFGKIYAIDPWHVEAALEGENEENKAWWKTIDLNNIHKLAMDAVWKHQLQEFVVVLRTYSHLCVQIMPFIDVLLIDGNHSEIASTRDVNLYLPKVKRGGHIWFDDADWPSTRKAQDLMEEKCDIVKDAQHYKLYRKR